MFEPLCAALDAAGIACTRNELLADHCTFRIGGPADIFIKPCDEIQLCRAVAFCKEQGARYYLLGNGSNILFEDAGFRGAVLDLTAMKTGIEMKENISGEESGVVYCSVTVGAGMKLSTLCNFALNHSCTGLEFAYGIPGTVGGAVYMNAGAYGSELKDVLESCGVSEDKRMQFGAQFDESFGGGAVLNPRNLIDVKKCVVKTPDVSITVNPERPDLIETRTLGGVRYILIKADEGVELNGIDLAEEAE